MAWIIQAVLKITGVPNILQKISEMDQCEKQEADFDNLRLGPRPAVRGNICKTTVHEEMRLASQIAHGLIGFNEITEMPVNFDARVEFRVEFRHGQNDSKTCLPIIASGPQALTEVLQCHAQRVKALSRPIHNTVAKNSFRIKKFAVCKHSIKYFIFFVAADR